MKSAAIIAVTALLSSAAVPAAAQLSVARPEGRIIHRRDGDTHSLPLAVVKLRARGKLMLVPVRLRGRGAYLFAVDSAAPNSLVDAGLAQDLRLPLRSQPTAPGQPAVRTVWLAAMKIGGAGVFTPGAQAVDLSAPNRGRQGVRQTVRGVLGAELFHAYVVRFDVSRGSLALYDPAAFRPTIGAIAIPLTRTEDGLLYVPLILSPLGQPAAAHPALLDTGSPTLVSDPAAAAAPPVGQARLADAEGRVAVSPAARVYAVQVGPYALNTVWAETQGGPKIGMEWLRRFVVTIDAPHGRMYLEPTARTWEPAPAPN